MKVEGTQSLVGTDTKYVKRRNRMWVKLDCCYKIYFSINIYIIIKSLFCTIFDWLYILNYLKLYFSGDASKPQNVVWDTSPVKTRHWVLESLSDVNVSLDPEGFDSDLRLVNLDEKKQLGGV